MDHLGRIGLVRFVSPFAAVFVKFGQGQAAFEAKSHGGLLFCYAALIIKQVLMKNKINFSIVHFAK